MANDDNEATASDLGASTVEGMVRQQLQDTTGSVAQALEMLARRVREAAADYDRIGDPGLKTYVGVTSEIAAAVVTGTSQLRIDRLASLAVAADIDRALRAAKAGPLD